MISTSAALADLRNLASPGPLAEAHAGLERQCDKCHVPFKGIPDTSCLGCHAAVQQKIERGLGPHAAFVKSGDKCTKCHKDHRGRGHEMTPEIDRSFNHATTGFALDGRHAGAACGLCHQGKKWIGVPTTCVGCHGDTHHKGALGKDCQRCHAPAGWSPPLRAAVQHKLPMTGAHAGLACAKCHDGGKNLKSSSQCRDCHTEKHGGTKAPCDRCHNTNDWHKASFQHDFCTCILPGKHQTADCLKCHPKFVFNPTPFACEGCHDKDRKHEPLGACSRCHSALSWKKKVFDHNKQVKNFPIDGNHAFVGCENCHTKPGVFKGAPTACAGCHKTPEGHGDFGACAQCHTTGGFKPSSFKHEKTRFPLDGPHAKVACANCHEKKFKKGTYAPGPNACALCHGDPHEGQFKEQKGQKAELKIPGLLQRSNELQRSNPEGFSGLLQRSNQRFVHLSPVDAADSGSSRPVAPHGNNCRDCHLADKWKPSTIGVKEHERFKFALTGAHQKISCTLCHTGGQFVGTQTSCAKCHFDAHAGRFGAECQSCHETNAWSPAPKFDHKGRTGFALEGAHARAACAGCHGDNGDKLDKVARPIGCATCHTAKTHGMQFGANCSECHHPAKRFIDVPKFDHRAKTNFPLERRHAAIRCGACHDVRRAAAVSRECWNCHGDPHLGNAGTQCQDCHRADRWLLVRFDHDRSEFPLRGRHFTTPCKDCHQNNLWVGVRTECVNCHARDVAAASRPHAPTDLNCTNAMGCHKNAPFTWRTQ